MTTQATGPAVLGAWLDREAKYSGKWAQRFVRFDAGTRVMSYGESDQKMKAAILVSAVKRRAEEREMRATDRNLLSIEVHGTPDSQGAAAAEGQVSAWVLRFPDHDVYMQWYTAMRAALAAVGQCEPYDYGLPPADPRSNLEFVHLPIESLFRFSLLEKAIFFYFGLCTVAGPEEAAAASTQLTSTSGTTGSHYLMVGDKYVYIFRANADVVRCWAITSISRIVVGDTFFAFKIDGQHDFLARTRTAHVREIVRCVKQLFSAMRGEGKLPPEEVWSGTVEQLTAQQQLALAPAEGYKVNIVSPTPKARLKQALDAYSKSLSPGGGDGGSPSPSAQRSSSGGGGDGGGGGSRARQDSLSNANVTDELSQLLIKLGLPQYVRALKRQHLDIDVISCMEPTDLANFGVGDPRHRELIVGAATNGIDSVRDQLPSSVSPPGGAGNSDGTAGRQRSDTLASADSLDVGTADSVGRPPVVDLDDSDDDGLPPPPSQQQQKTAPPGGGGGGGGPKVVINLDSDDDDDLGLLPVRRDTPPPVAAAAAAASPPPSASKGIVLSDDDDI